MKHSEMPTIEAVKELHRAGMATYKIAEHFGCDKASIRRRLHATAPILPGAPPRKFDEAKMHEMRAQGKTVYEIAEELGCSPTLVHIYVARRAVPEAVTQRNRATWRKNVRKATAASGARAKARRDTLFGQYAAEKPSEDDLFMAGLYAGEGAKVAGRFQLANSNPTIVNFTVKYLHKMGLTGDKILLAVYLHDDRDGKAVAKFWEELTGLPGDRIRIYFKKAGTNPKRHSLPYGTVSVIACGRMGIPFFERMRAMAEKFVSTEPKTYKGGEHVTWKDYSPK